MVGGPGYFYDAVRSNANSPAINDHALETRAEALTVAQAFVASQPDASAWDFVG